MQKIGIDKKYEHIFWSRKSNVKMLTNESCLLFSVFSIFLIHFHVIKNFVYASSAKLFSLWTHQTMSFITACLFSPTLTHGLIYLSNGCMAQKNHKSTTTRPAVKDLSCPFLLETVPTFLAILWKKCKKIMMRLSGY